ncbi:GntR family transcriptional regulator [Marinobacter santoriniensis]|nr:GntR family transcriptional regulator [Marinobacter santoriniensis]
MPIGKITPQRLADTIVEALETMILEGTLNPGERLPPERSLAEQFGVSRASLREAVHRLAAKGLLISRQGGGHYVTENLGTSFSDPLVELLEHHPEARRDLLEFRRTLEADCAYYAAQRATQADRARLTETHDALQACYADDSGRNVKAEGEADARFHLSIAEASHNAVLLLTVRNLFRMLERSMVTNIDGMNASETENRNGLKQQHSLLFNAIMEGRAEDARSLAGAHIQYVQRALSERTETRRRQERASRREMLSRGRPG